MNASCRSAAAILDWGWDAYYCIQALIDDHAHLASGGSVSFVIDAYDVIELCFPYGGPRERSAQSGDRYAALCASLEAQVGRACVFYGLPEDASYYPILVPPPYGAEIFRFLRAPASGERRCDLAASLAQLAEAMQESGLDAKAIAERAQSGEPDAQRFLAQQLLRVNPQLLYLVTGLFRDGADLLRRLFRERRLTFRPEEWGVPPAVRARCKDPEYWGFNFLDHDGDVAFRQKYVDPLGVRFVPSYYSDVKAIRFALHMNDALADAGHRTLYISGAEMVRRVLESGTILSKAGAEQAIGDGLRTLSLLRPPDVFRLYSSLAMRSGTRTRPDPSAVLLAAREEGRRITPIILQPDLWRFYKYVKRDCTAAGEGSEECQRCFWGRSIDGLGRQVRNLEYIRSEIESANLAIAGRFYMRTLETDRQEGALTNPRSYEATVAAPYAELIAGSLRSFMELEDQYFEAIAERRISLANECLGWIAISCLGSGGELTAQVELVSGFAMFPFRVRFATPSIRRSALEIISALEGGAYESEEKVRVATGRLAILAERCAGARDPGRNFWGRVIDITDYKDVAAIERRLIWHVLLFALGYYTDVGEDAARMEGVVEPCWREEFFIIGLQARIRGGMEMTSGRREAVVRDVVGEIERRMNADGWSDDPRLHHLAAYAIGTTCRLGKISGGEWLSNKDRATALRHAGVCSELVERRLGSESDEMERAELLRLAWASAVNRAYYLAVGGDCADVEAAASLLAEYGGCEGTLSSTYWHNRGYVEFRRMAFAERADARRDHYREALSCYAAANRLRKHRRDIDDYESRDAVALRLIVNSEKSRLERDMALLVLCYRGEGL